MKFLDYVGAGIVTAIALFIFHFSHGGEQLGSTKAVAFAALFSSAVNYFHLCRIDARDDEDDIET